MGKFMKYEIRGSYKFILGVLALVILLTVGNFMLLNRNFNSDGSLMASGVFAMVSSLLVFGSFITLMFYIVNLFRNDLYEDRGYLTFTLPMSSRQILFSKLVVAFMWIVIVIAGFIIANVLGAVSVMPKEVLSEMLDMFKNINSAFIEIDIPSLLYGMFEGIASSMLLLLVIYFSMTLGRVSFQNKKFKGIWFVVFIVLMILYTYISFKIGYVSPTVHLSKYIYINIGTLAFELVCILGFFFGTSYLIEHKMEV